MFFFLSPTASVLLGLFVAGLATVTVVCSVVRCLFSTEHHGNIHFKAPFTDLDVKPVSDGDRVVYAYFLKGKYTALIENKRKKAKLEFKAGTKENLESMVQDTFRAWAIAGKKKPGTSYFR